MVSSRLVDFPDDADEEITGPFPDLMFAEGEEPVGVRVLTYQSSRAINTILEALDDDEIQYLRQTPFGKLVDIAEKPGFSGRFARYLLSRQLKVEKKYEAWFRFASKPIRFSLREFAIVTGLPCGEFPKKCRAKKKKNIKEKPYWPELFGSVEEVSVSRAVKMLRKKIVTDRDIRIKIACLAIVSSVLLSTNLRMKMLKEHAELLVDIDEFFAFPWGRLAFDMLMTSIKKRDELSLSQNTIAMKGFALALQLVIVEAVPALMEVVQETCSSSESDTDEEDVDCLQSSKKKQTLSPAHAREVDRKSEAVVTCILPVDPANPVEESLCIRPDDVPDVKVDKLVRRIMANQDIPKDMLRGGLTKADVEKMREKAKEGGKRKQQRQKPKAGATPVVEEPNITSVVEAIIRPQIERMEGTVAAAVASAIDASSNALAYKASVVATVEEMLSAFKSEILSFFPSISIQMGGHKQQTTPQPGGLSTGFVPQNTTPRRVNENDDIIENVMENISHYSTPPESGNRCSGSEAQSRRQGSHVSSVPHGEKSNKVTEHGSVHTTKPRSAKRLSVNGSEAQSRREGSPVSSVPNGEKSNKDTEHGNGYTTKSSSANHLSVNGSQAQSRGEGSPVSSVPNGEKSNKDTEHENAHTAKSTSAKRLSVNGSVSESPMEGTNGATGDVSQAQNVFTSSVSAHSQTHGGSDQNAVNVSVEPEIPSFSLGLTQEIGPMVTDGEDDAMEENHNNLVVQEKEPDVCENEDSFSCRKSKRLKQVPTLLITDYQCGTSILNRAREGPMFWSTYYDSSVVCDKYLRLKFLLKKECVINVCGLSVTGKDIVDIGERERMLPGRVVDILTKVVSTNFNNLCMGRSENTPVFLDSRVHVLLARNYPKFKKANPKDAYVFTKAMVDCVRKGYSDVSTVTRFYMPVNVNRGHWVGLCVDLSSSKIFVLDCNSLLTMDSALVKELLPISEMFPHLLKHLGNVVHPAGNRLLVERVKGIPHNNNPADAALTAALLIQSHAMFGSDACKSITTSIIPVEAQRAAVMVYEFHQKL